MKEFLQGALLGVIAIGIPIVIYVIQTGGL